MGMCVCTDANYTDVECHFDYDAGDPENGLNESINIHKILRDDTDGDVKNEYNSDDIEDFENQIWNKIH